MEPHLDEDGIAACRHAMPTAEIPGKSFAENIGLWGRAPEVGLQKAEWQRLNFDQMLSTSLTGFSPISAFEQPGCIARARCPKQPRSSGANARALVSVSYPNKSPFPLNWSFRFPSICAYLK
jgi:hypothetical protein